MPTQSPTIQKSVEETYQKLSHVEQILLRPDTYIGSTEPTEAQMWVVENPADLQNIRIARRSVCYVPGFIKLFDEILTNASDHKQRGGGVKTIKVSVDDQFNVKVWNDGSGIPIEYHAKEQCYVPELIFGHLLTGSNYDDSEERFGGGRNGYGAKLSNIFSQRFRVKTCDGKKAYEQAFYNNMGNKQEPAISAARTPNQFTEVVYTTDWDRLPIVGMEQDTMRIMLKRTLDIAAYNPDVKVYFNDVLLPINSLKDYAKMHVEEGAELFHERINDRFDLVIAQSFTDSFEQVSIVNGISTHSGGSHVDMLMNQVVAELREQITKGKKTINVKPHDVRSKLFFFIVARIPNPSFDTQTKERLTSKMTQDVTLGAQVSDKTMKAVMKSEIVASIMEWVALKEQAELAKINKGKSTRVKIAKLQDANLAGTKDGHKCALFLAEGDSAKTGCVSGMSVVGTDLFGVFPLKGKPLNVRDQAVSKIKDNAEIANIITALGLVIGKKYADLSELRYGKLVIMSDADNDGTHIKGLILNMFHTFWPELLRMGFLYEFVTPIMRAFKGKESLSFYNQDAYNAWMAKSPQGYKVKYYKGLGTIKPDEMKDLFKEIDKHLIRFAWSDEAGGELIDKVFNKKRADDRKDWLTQYKGDVQPDKFGKDNELTDFFSNEFIQFSMADNVRSIPQLLDGFKPGQRKVMFTCFKRNLREELKVAQLAGAVAETSAYHHGEMSLVQTIVGMAQDFVGSNNVNLLVPSGQFGSRLQGGSDAASGRYIFTYLAKATRLIFRPEDDGILDYLEDDGTTVEPAVYLPVVPMVLVNGADGIGTGWSTSIPKFAIRDVVAMLEAKIEGKRTRKELAPAYRGFQGAIERDAAGKWVSTGVGKRGAKNTFHITELPVYTWTEKYVEFLDKLVDDKVIKDYKNASTDVAVNITVKLSADLEGATDAQLYDTLKMRSTLNTTNMHVFDGHSIVKYDSPEAILDAFYEQRLVRYATRKEHLLRKLKEAYAKQANIYKFLALVTRGDLQVMHRPKADIVADLDAQGFHRLEGGFDYLLGLPVQSLTTERMEDAKRNRDERKAEFEALKVKEPSALWLEDLQELKDFLKKAA